MYFQIYRNNLIQRKEEAFTLQLKVCVQLYNYISIYFLFAPHVKLNLKLNIIEFVVYNNYHKIIFFIIIPETSCKRSNVAYRVNVLPTPQTVVMMYYAYLKQ